MLRAIRASAFYAGAVVITLVYALLLNCLRVGPCAARHRLASHYARVVLHWLNLTCGVKLRICGLERLPSVPAVLACKHYSAWETLALQGYLPPHTWVVKRELLNVPLFGWGLRTLKPIAIDRAAAANSIKQVIEQGQRYLGEGLYVLIFPQATRVAIGEQRAYSRSAAKLAIIGNAPLVPIAHNAALAWPRNTVLKNPMTVDLVIGPPIPWDSDDASGLTARCERWIEQECDRLIAPARS